MFSKGSLINLLDSKSADRTYTDGPARDTSNLLNISATEEVVWYQPKVAVIMVASSEYICSAMSLSVLDTGVKINMHLG